MSTLPASDSDAPRHGLSRLASRSLLAAMSSVGGRVVKLGLHLLISRSFGPLGYGAYATGFSVAAFAQNLPGAGLDQTLIRFVPTYAAQRDERAARAVITLAWGFTSVAGVIVSLAIVLLAGQLASVVFHDASIAGDLRIFGASLIFFDWIVIGSATAQALHRPVLASVLQDVAPPAIGLASLALLLFVASSPAAPAASFLISSAAVGTAAFAGAARLFRLGWRALPSGYIRAWIGYSLWMALIEAAIYALSGLTTLSVAVFRGVHDAGIFAAAAAIVAQSSLLWAGLILVLPPMLADVLARDDRHTAERLVRASMRWLAIAGVPFFLLVVVYGRQLLKVFGAGFEPGYPALVALAVGGFVVAVTFLSSFVLVIAGRQRVDAVNCLGACAAALVLYPLGARTGGMLGVALMSSLVGAGLAAARLIEADRLLRIRLWDWSLVRVAVSGAALIVLFALGPLLGFAGGGFARLLWAGVCLLGYAVLSLRLLSAEDRALIGDFRARLRQVMAR